MLVRHATAASTDLAAGLSARGRAEAVALAGRLGDRQIDVAWSSDLKRAVETAGAILTRHPSIPLRQSEALREVDRPAGLDPAVDPGGYQAWERETVAGLARGLQEWLGIVAGGEGPGVGSSVDAPHNRTILVVSHGGPLRVLICLLLGLPPDRQWAFRLDHASLTVVEHGGDLGTLTLLNDRSHVLKVFA